MNMNFENQAIEKVNSETVLEPLNGVHAAHDTELTHNGTFANGNHNLVHSSSLGSALHATEDQPLSHTQRAALSERELQIVLMIGSGKSVGNIAVELGLSVKTVSTYRVRALRKLGLNNNADLIRYVISQNLDETK